MEKTFSIMKSLITKIGDRYISPKEIREFVLRKSTIFNQKAILSENLLEEWQILNANLSVLGWQNNTAVDQKGNIIYWDNGIIQNAIDWINTLENGRIINHGIIAENSGFFLDILDKRNENLNGPTIAGIESLLKFFEVKRKKAIRAFQRELSPNRMILNGLQISVLFSRAALRHHDLRYLNIALKMNEWYLPIIKKESDTALIIIFLLAMTEQEIAALELLP